MQVKVFKTIKGKEPMQESPLILINDDTKAWFIFDNGDWIERYRPLFETKEELVNVDRIVKGMYGSASELRATLEYDFSEERKFSYKHMTM